MRHLSLLSVVFCAALVSCVGQKQFTIETTPSGATVTINGRLIEGKTTPLIVDIKEDKDLGIVVEKPGYSVGAATVYTKTSWWRSLLWTENDPRARYIEEDSICIPMQPLRTNATYTPTILEPFRFPEERGPLSDSKAPELRPLPKM